MAQNKLEQVNSVNIRNASNGVIVEKMGTDKQRNWAEPEYQVKTEKEASMLRKSLGLSGEGEKTPSPPLTKTFEKGVFDR